MKPNTWGGSTPKVEKKSDESNTKSSKDKGLLYIKKREELERERYTPSFRLPIGSLKYVGFFGLAFLFMIYGFPFMTDVIDDVDFETLFVRENNNDAIPDNAQFTVVVRAGYTEYGNIIHVFNVTKGELVAYNVCYVTEDAVLVPHKQWEPWRNYLINVKGFTIPEDSIFVEVHFSEDYY